MLTCKNVDFCSTDHSNHLGVQRLNTRYLTKSKPCSSFTHAGVEKLLM